MHNILGIIMISYTPCDCKCKLTEPLSRGCWLTLYLNPQSEGATVINKECVWFMLRNRTK